MKETGIVGSTSSLAFADSGALGRLDRILLGVGLRHIIVDDGPVDIGPEFDGAKLFKLLERGIDGRREGESSVINKKTRVLVLILALEGGAPKIRLATADALNLVDPRRVVAVKSSLLDACNSAADNVGATLVGKGEVGAKSRPCTDKVKVSCPGDVLCAKDDVLDEHVRDTLLQFVRLGLTTGETEGDTKTTEGADGHRVAVEGDIKDPIALDSDAVRRVVDVKGRAGRMMKGLFGETKGV